MKKRNIYNDQSIPNSTNSLMFLFSFLRLISYQQSLDLLTYNHLELIYSAYITVLDLKLSWFYFVFTCKISDKLITKVPQKTRIDRNNSVD